MLPPYLPRSQCQSDLDDIVRGASCTTISERLKKIVINKAQADDSLLKEDQIAIAESSMGLAISVGDRVHVKVRV